VRRWSKAEQKTVNNGSYKDEETAARASDDLARELIANGEHHQMNFPDDKTDSNQRTRDATEKKQTSTYIGVYRDGERWHVKRWSKKAKKSISHGSHKDEEAAAHASDALAREFMANGEENHKLNFPEESLQVCVCDSDSEKLKNENTNDDENGKRKRDQIEEPEVKEPGHMHGVQWRRGKWVVKRHFNIVNKWKQIWGGTYEKDQLEDAKRASDALELKHGKKSNPKLNYPLEMYEKEENKMINSEAVEKFPTLPHKGEQEAGNKYGVYWKENEKRWYAQRNFSFGAKGRRTYKTWWGGSFKKDDVEAAMRASDDLVLEYEQSEGKKCGHNLNYPPQTNLGCENEKVASAEAISTPYVPEIAIRPHVVEQVTAMLTQIYNYFDALWDYYSERGLDSSEIEYAMDLFRENENSIFQQVAERPLYAFLEAQTVKKSYHLPLVPVVGMLCENGITREETFAVLMNLVKTEIGVTLDQEKMAHLWNARNQTKR
jgi:hypothetical protein